MKNLIKEVSVEFKPHKDTSRYSGHVDVYARMIKVGKLWIRLESVVGHGVLAQTNSKLFLQSVSLESASFRADQEKAIAEGFYTEVTDYETLKLIKKSCCFTESDTELHGSSPFFMSWLPDKGLANALEVSKIIDAVLTAQGG